MKLLIHDRFGPPEEVLRLAEEPARPLGPGEVRIRVEATPIHAGDPKNIAGEKTMVRHGQSGDDLKVPLPQVPGVEGLGRITEVASGAGLTVGTRVFLPWQCGSWREEVIAKATEAMPAPEGDPIQLSLMINA